MRPWTVQLQDFSPPTLTPGPSPTLRRGRGEQHLRLSGERGPMRAGMYHPSCERLVVDTGVTLETAVARAMVWILEQLRLPSPAESGERLGVRS